jgi:hypothetical protein
VKSRDNVKFSKVTNKSFTVDTNFPKYDAQGLDYTTIFANDTITVVNDQPTISLPVYLLGNSGSGGARMKGDGVRYCDMRGSGTGMYT